MTILHSRYVEHVTAPDQVSQFHKPPMNLWTLGTFWYQEIAATLQSLASLVNFSPRACVLSCTAACRDEGVGPAGVAATCLNFAATLGLERPSAAGVLVTAFKLSLGPMAERHSMKKEVTFYTNRCICIYMGKLNPMKLSS